MKTKSIQMRYAILAAACMLAMAPDGRADSDRKAVVESAAADEALVNLTLRGSNLLQVRNPVVRLSGSAAALPILAATDTAITVLLPAGIASGSYYVTLAGIGAGAGNDEEFPITLGARGVAGAQGPQGAQGATGPQGVAGESVTLASLGAGSSACAYGGSQLTAGGISSFACNGVPGAAGIAGQAGAVGPAGPQGPKGDSGSAGATGVQGAKGDSGAAGAAGPQGVKGDTGSTGASGAQGSKGDVGPTGPVGPQGLTGPIVQVQGPAGPLGPPGPVAITGQAMVSTTVTSPVAIPKGSNEIISVTGVEYPTAAGSGTNGSLGIVDAWVNFAATVFNNQDSAAFCKVTFTPELNGQPRQAFVAAVNHVANTTSHTLGVPFIPNGSVLAIRATTDCPNAQMSDYQVFVALIRR
jgi:hypothetical protein